MAEPLLEARGISKRYGHVRALDGADFSVFAAEVVALIGDNGAGKSTLVKAFLARCGRTAARSSWTASRFPSLVRSTRSATASRPSTKTSPWPRISMPRPTCTSAGNCTRSHSCRVLDRKAMRERAAAAFAELGVELPDMRAPVATLSGGQRQSVAVARVVSYARKVIFMDEPTAALGVVQRARVLDTMRRVRDRGISVVMISHNMPEVLAVADRIEVLRLGRRVARFSGGGHLGGGTRRCHDRGACGQGEEGGR